MERIGDDVERELRRFGPSGEMAAIVAAWPGAVGEMVARNAWPARLTRDRTLVVHTSSSTWAFELGQLAARVLGRLAEALPGEPPAALRFVPGRIPEPPPTHAETVRREGPTVDRSAAERAAELAGEIGDPELRERVARAAALSLAAAAGRPF